MSPGRALGGLALAVALTALASCGGDEAPADVDAPALLERSATRMEQLRTFHYLLEFEGGASEVLTGLQMQRAEGDFAGTDNLQGEIRAKAGPIDARVEIRIVNGESWFTNPLTGRWQRQQFSVEQLFDLSTGVTALMRSARNPRVTGTETIDGAEVHRVEADLPSDEFRLLPEVRPGETLKATAWIGQQDDLVRRLEVSGRIFQASTSDGTARLTLTRFDEPVTVEVPN